MNVLDSLAVPHPYYCSEMNYFSNDPNMKHPTMTDFLAEYEDADIDMNLIFRWDIKPVDEDHPERKYAEVFIMHQRKGIFAPHHIENINEEEAARFLVLARKHWDKLREIWAPISGTANR